MIDWFLSGGVIMWPLLAIAVGILVLATRSALAFRRAGRAGAAREGRTVAAPAPEALSLGRILFWGAVALLVGALGTVVGIVIMARSISAAGGASAELVWGGVGLALISLAFGILVFLLAGFLWLALGTWRRRLTGLSDGGAWVALLLALSPMASGCDEADGAEFTLADSAGIDVVKNAAPDRPYPSGLHRFAELQPPDSALTAMPWGVVADPATGRIFVADGMSERVLVFDVDGRFLRAIGRAGEGPGEFRSPTALALTGSGHLAVWDARRGIISRWSPNGELLDEQQAPVNYWGPGFVIRRGQVLAVTQSTSGSERRQSLVQASGAGEPRELFAVTRELVPLELPGMSMPAPRIFAPDLIWTTRGDTTLVLHGPGYRIDGYVGGRLATSIRRDIPPVPVTAEMAAAHVAAGPFAGFMRRTGLTADQIVAAVGYEPEASPIKWLTVDPGGRLWVSRGWAGPMPDVVDVMDGDGRYLGTVDGAGLPVAFPSPSSVVTLQMAEGGRPLLELHRLEPRREPVVQSGSRSRQ